MRNIEKYITDKFPYTFMATEEWPFQRRLYFSLLTEIGIFDTGWLKHKHIKNIKETLTALNGSQFSEDFNSPRINFDIMIQMIDQQTFKGNWTFLPNPICSSIQTTIFCFKKAKDMDYFKIKLLLGDEYNFLER